LALLFAITSLSMGYITAHKSDSTKSILDTIKEVQKAEEIPAATDNVNVLKKAKKINNKK